MMTNGDPEGHIFLSSPHMIMDFFLTHHWILQWLLEVPKYAEMRHDMMTSLEYNNDVIFYLFA